jgi:hypothetical protein
MLVVRRVGPAAAMVAGRPSIEIAANGRESVAKTVEEVRRVPTGRK